MENLTALISTFARAYHYKNNKTPVFADSLAERMLTDEEYAGISLNMTQGISYFAPGFTGTQEEALCYIVDHQLAPSVLARSAFCERGVDNAVRTGCGQVVVYACGYDTFSLRTEYQSLNVFELDKPEVMADRKARIQQAGLKPICPVVSVGCDLSDPSWKEKLTSAGFDPKKLSFGSLLGISYYLSKEDFRQLIQMISSIACEGSFICFDYPLSEGGMESRRNEELAQAAGEEMKAKYTYDEIKEMLSDAEFLIHEHMDDREATALFFADHNLACEKHAMKAPEGVGYCLAVKMKS